MAGRGVGGMGAGCAGFSLIGLLLGVGLTVWLGAQVLDAIGPSPTTSTTKVELAGSLSVDPSGGLDDGDSVTVTASGLEAVTLQISPCLTPENRFELARCDEGRSVLTTRAADGGHSAAVVIARVITIEGTDVDCGRVPEICSLVAHGPESTVGPAAPLTFEPS